MTYVGGIPMFFRVSKVARGRAYGLRVERSRDGWVTHHSITRVSAPLNQCVEAH